MSELSTGNEALSFTVEGLECFHEVGEGTCVLLVHQLLVQWNEFFEFVRLLTHLLGATVFGNNGVCWVVSEAPEQISEFEGIYFTVTTVPEVKKVEDLTGV